MLKKTDTQNCCDLSQSCSLLYFSALNIHVADVGLFRVEVRTRYSLEVSEWVPDAPPFGLVALWRGDEVVRVADAEDEVVEFGGDGGVHLKNKIT